MKWQPRGEVPEWGTGYELPTPLLARHFYAECSPTPGTMTAMAAPAVDTTPATSMTDYSGGFWEVEVDFRHETATTWGGARVGYRV